MRLLTIVFGLFCGGLVFCQPIPPANSNAGFIQGRRVCGAAPSNTQVLVWDSTAKCYKPAAQSGGGTTPTTTTVTAAATTVFTCPANEPSHTFLVTVNVNVTNQTIACSVPFTVVLTGDGVHTWAWGGSVTNGALFDVTSTQTTTQDFLGNGASAQGKNVTYSNPIPVIYTKNGNAITIPDQNDRMLTMFGQVCQDAGNTSAYACSVTSCPAALQTGGNYSFKANTTNTGAATFNFCALGAQTIKKVAGGITTDLAANDIRAGQWVDLRFDGTNFQMQSLLGNGGATVGATATIPLQMSMYGDGAASGVGCWATGGGASSNVTNNYNGTFGASFMQFNISAADAVTVCSLPLPQDYDNTKAVDFSFLVADSSGSGNTVQFKIQAGCIASGFQSNTAWPLSTGSLMGPTAVGINFVNYSATNISMATGTCDVGKMLKLTLTAVKAGGTSASSALWVVGTQLTYRRK